ncbi:MAG: hypothetical protein N2112_01140 [Gemmataceae bacterium]|jgi:hypothetical protein|nr:hypothetical protein [Gemmataceae bacterium]
MKTNINLQQSLPPSRYRWLRPLWAIFLTLLVVVLAFSGIFALSKAARESLGPRERFLLPFQEIECRTPPHQEKADFLGEVQYLGAFPDKINLLERGLSQRLEQAFQKHKQVEAVEKVEILPSRRIRVSLSFKK